MILLTLNYQALVHNFYQYQKQVANKFSSSHKGTGGCRGHDHMVVEFTTICVIRTYRH